MTNETLQRLFLHVVPPDRSRGMSDTPEISPASPLLSVRSKNSSAPLLGSRLLSSSHAQRRLQGMLWFRITPKHDVLSVQVRLLRPPPHITFFLPGAWAGRTDWSSQIRVIGAHTEKGETPLTLRRSNGRLDVSVPPHASFIEIDYDVTVVDRVHVDHRFAPQRIGSDFFAYAPTLLVLPSEEITRSIRDILIEVRTPSNWSATTTWSLTSVALSRHDSNTKVWGYSRHRCTTTA